MINANTTFDKKAVETIRKKVKKMDFFRIFRDFFRFFGTDFEKMDNFWITLCVFWIMVDNL
jgi:hypothetical protein